MKKDFSEYTLQDVVELSRLKLQIGQLAMQARAKTNEADSKYRLDRSKLYVVGKLEKMSDKLATEQAFIDTELARIEVNKLLAESELISTYHRDLNDIVISVRMASKAYDEFLQTKQD